jgi:hypothetical protein
MASRIAQARKARQAQRVAKKGSDSVGQEPCDIKSDMSELAAGGEGASSSAEPPSAGAAA